MCRYFYPVALRYSKENQLLGDQFGHTNEEIIYLGAKAVCSVVFYVCSKLLNWIIKNFKIC